MSRTREERESCILWNDAGEVVVWTVSPIYQRRLAKRLGEPDRIDGTCHTWTRPKSSLSLILPSRKRIPSPEQREKAQRMRAERQNRASGKRIPD